MKTLILCLILISLVITGCNSQSASTQNNNTQDDFLVGHIDPEAESLGFPEVFISKESNKINWSYAKQATVDGMDVAIYDTGRTVEVCGGLGCDK